MYNLKIYQICHDLIVYFATLTSPKKSQLGIIFRTGGSINYFLSFYLTIYLLLCYIYKLSHFFGQKNKMISHSSHSSIDPKKLITLTLS